MFTRQKRKKSISIVIKTRISEEKLMEQFGPRPLSTNPVISQQFANLRVLDKKEECDVFEGGGVDTPMHTVSFHFKHSRK